MECIRRIQNSIDENIRVLNATHLTEEETDEYRSCLSAVSFRNRLPVTVYLSVVAVMGFIGNALVILVYWQSFKSSASRIFVMAMAIEDMTTSVIALPLTIITIRYAYNSYSKWLCRVTFATAMISTQTSGLVLVATALYRFSRVWWPQKTHITEHQSYVINIVIFSFAHLLFAGFVPMFGIHSYPSHIEGVSVKMCWYDDEYAGTLYPKAFAHVVDGIVLGGLVLMTISYILIGIKVWQRRTPTPESLPLTATSFQSGSTEYPVQSIHASEASAKNKPQENRESMATKGGADVQAASASAHDITVVEISTVPYPFKSAMSTTKAAWRKKEVSYEEDHHPEITPNLHSKGPSPPSNDPNQPLKHPNLPSNDLNQPLIDPNPPSKDEKTPSTGSSPPSKDPNQPLIDPNPPSKDEKTPSTGSSPPSKDPNPQQNDLNRNPNDPSLPSEDPSPSPLTENLGEKERSDPVDIVEKDTAQESLDARGNYVDEEKILLNNGGTSLRNSPLKTKLGDDHNDKLKLIIVSHADTTEESVTELSLESVNSSESGVWLSKWRGKNGHTGKIPLVQKHECTWEFEPTNAEEEEEESVNDREYVNNELSSQLPFARSQRNPCPKPVKITQTASLHTRKIRSRTTLMMSILTFFYVVNWIPYNYMRFTHWDPVNLCSGYTDCGANIEALCYRSLYLNSAVNAFVYSFCSSHFRKELGRMLRGLCRRFRRKL